MKMAEAVRRAVGFLERVFTLEEERGRLQRSERRVERRERLARYAERGVGAKVRNEVGADFPVFAERKKREPRALDRAEGDDDFAVGGKLDRAVLGDDAVDTTGSARV